MQAVAGEALQVQRCCVAHAQPGEVIGVRAGSSGALQLLFSSNSPINPLRTELLQQAARFSAEHSTSVCTEL